MSLGKRREGARDYPLDLLFSLYLVGDDLDTIVRDLLHTGSVKIGESQMTDGTLGLHLLEVAQSIQIIRGVIIPPEE